MNRKLFMGQNGSSGFTGIMDTISHTPLGAWSVRQLYEAASNSCSIREDGGDTLADIGFVDGDFDETALIAHLGANNGFFHTWYDQSTAAEDVTQATNSKQFEILTTSGFRAAYNDGSVRGLANNTFSASQDFYIFMVGTDLGGGTTKYFLQSGNIKYVRMQTTGQLRLVSPTALTTGTSVSGFTHSQFTAYVNGVSSQIWQEGVSAASGDAGADNWTSGIGIGANKAVSGACMNGYLHEVIICSGISDTDRQTIEADIINYYSI